MLLGEANWTPETGAVVQDEREQRGETRRYAWRLRLAVSAAAAAAGVAAVAARAAAVAAGGGGGGGRQAIAVAGIVGMCLEVGGMPRRGLRLQPAACMQVALARRKKERRRRKRKRKRKRRARVQAHRLALLAGHMAS